MSDALGADVAGVGLDLGLLCQGWWPQPGGVEAHTRALARGLAARGHRVHVLCLDRVEVRDAHSVRVSVEDGVEVRRMAPPRTHRALADLVCDPRADDVVLAWLAETPCDLVHVHHLTGFGVGALRAISDMGRPLAVTLHDHWLACPCGQPLHAAGDAAGRLACLRAHWPQLLPSGGGEARGPGGERPGSDEEADAARLAYVRSALALPDLVLAPSAAVLAAHAGLGIDADRTRVVEHGIDVEGLAAAVRAQRSARPRPAGDLLRLGVLGAVLPGKGVAELLEAFLASDAEGLAVDVHGPLLDFHGDCSHLERVGALAARSQRIGLHGPYAPADLPRVLAGLDAVAAPSVWDEVFGLSVREARAAGLPVLVSDRGGLPAAAQDGAAGCVLPAGDVSAWAAALRELADDAELRARWSATPPTVRTLEAMTLEHERLYVETVARGTGRVPELARPREGAPGAEARPQPKRPGGGWLRRLLGR